MRRSKNQKRKRYIIVRSSTSHRDVVIFVDTIQKIIASDDGICSIFFLSDELVDVKIQLSKLMDMIENS